MTYEEMMKNAKTCMGPYCKACDACNGKVCRNRIPGPGAKGTGDNAIRNYDKWQEVRVNMDCLCRKEDTDTRCTLFGKTFQYPIFAGPVGAVNLHYGDKYNDMEYNDILVSGCAKAGIAAFTGDGTNPDVVKAAAKAIAKADGLGIPTIKPWNKETIDEKIALVRESNAFAIAMDIDAAGLPFLKNMNPPAGAKSVKEMKEIVRQAGVPFIIKGIMTVEGAKKALEAGAAGIVVSNHGGRVLDQCPATAEVLKEIADAVKGSMKIFVDGGIRSGTDVFKALAMGADAVIIARPYVVSVYGGGEEGVKLYTDKVGNELADTMAMCGAGKLSDIHEGMVRLPKCF